MRSSFHPRRVSIAAAAVLVAGIAVGGVRAADGAAVSGFVLDLSGRPLPGATVSVDGSGRRVSVAPDGRYVLVGLPSGPVTLVARSVGHEPQRVEIDLEPGERRDLPSIALAVATYHDEVVVDARLVDAEARALARETEAINVRDVVAADQLGQYPDRNAAEAAQRLPGVVISRDQGEAREASVRGTPPAWSSVMLDGERIPSGEADERSVALDVVPLELLEGIEIAKTLTPDMDADAIGGAIDLVVRRPPRGTLVTATAGAGVDDLSDGDRVNLAGTAGGRFADDRVGVLVSASGSEIDRGTDALDSGTFDDEPEDVRFQRSLIERTRYGAALSLDGQPGAGTSLLLRGLWSEFEDHELRRRKVQRLGEESIDRVLKDRTEGQTIWSVAGSGASVLGTETLLEYELSWQRADEDEPFRQDTTFTQEEVEFEVDENAPDGPWGSVPLDEDIESFVLSEISREQDTASTEALAGGLDLSRAVSFGAAADGHWKAGLKLRASQAERDDNTIVYEGTEEAVLVDWLDPSWPPDTTIFGRYELGPFSDPTGSRSLVDRFELEGERDPEDDLGDYTADEDTVAAYGLLEVGLGSRVGVNAGLRWEQTETSYVAHELVVDEEGELAGVTPVTGGGRYDEPLPMVNVRWGVSDRDVVRGAVTRTLARPNLEWLAPFRLDLEEEGEIFLGNPDLRPTTAWNLDLAFERTLEPLGQLSIAAFGKSLDDVIAEVRTDIEVDDEDEITVIQPRNAGDGELLGIELGYRNRLRRLPGALSGLGLFVNYTFTDSDLTVDGRSGLVLPFQTRHAGNLAVSYERAGFSGRVAFNYHDEYLEELGEEPGLDLWVAERTQVDLYLRQQVTDRLSLFLEAINLTDEPLERFLGVTGEPVSTEEYGWWATVGVRFDF